MYQKLLLSIVICFIAFSNDSNANDLMITNLVRTGNSITFSVSWENSWYEGITYHDAVWLFVKQAPQGGPSWQHTNITSASTNSGYTVKVTSDQVGVFLRRASNGSGSASTSVTLNLTGLLGNFQDLKLMGIEMVYVPSGEFYAGDGASGSRIAAGNDINKPFNITSENAVSCGSNSTNFQYSHTSCTNIPSAFPKGYSAFYSMKYVITQGQYVDFLNCLSRTQQENRVNTNISGSSITNVYVMSDTSTPSRGNVIRCDAQIGNGPISFYCDRNQNGTPNEADDAMSRACNYLSASDWIAYLDWAGLRPASFLEIEKAARGPLRPVANEYSWGSSLWSNNGSLEDAGTESERWSNSYTDGGISTYFDDVIRVGSNAPSSNATRELSNASFYGIIDLGNNPGDYFIGIDYVTSFKSIDGDGELTTTGKADVSTWPVFGTSCNLKFASQATGISYLSIISQGNDPHAGGRGVRSNF